jgi:futalosine hydrolase
MILAVAATQMEMDPFREQLGAAAQRVATLVCGVGPVEAAVRLLQYMQDCAGIQLVVNFGVGGAYLQKKHLQQPKLLDLCLATSEVFGDVGICFGDRLEYLDERFTGRQVIALDADYRRRTGAMLDRWRQQYHSGTFVTVAGVSGTVERGRFLQEHWQALCENMEGAALARVCREQRVPMLELRVISNLVEDRNPALWRLVEAATLAGRTAAHIVLELSNG